MWVRVSLQSLKLQLSPLFGIQATTECILTLERVCDIIRTHRQAFWFFFAGYDIYLAVEFVKECDERKTNSDRLVANLTAQETEMLQMKEEIRELINYTDGVCILWSFISMFMTRSLKNLQIV